jgi:hypothetical protein
VRRDRNTDHGYTGFRYHTGTRTGSRNTTRAPRRDVTMPCTCYSMHCETKSTLLNHCYLSPAHHPSNCAIRPIIPRINKSHSAQPRFLRGPSFYDKFAPTPRSARHLPPRTLSALDAKFRLLPDQSAPIAKNYYTNAVAT